MAKSSKHQQKQKQKQHQVRKLAALSTLAEQRRDTNAVSAALVQATLERFMPPGNKRWLEIGSGAGQLYRWLPEAARQRVLLSEASARFVEPLKRAFGDEKVCQADVHHLKFGKKEFSAVLGLCVLDVVTSARAAAELGQVLESGGLVLHWLDMGTNLEPVITQAVQSGLVVLPNFVDVGLARALGVELPEALGKPSPLADLVVAPRAQLLALSAFLRSIGHAQASAFERHLAAFDPQGFDPRIAAQALVRLSASDPQLFEFRKTLLALYVASLARGEAVKLPLDARQIASLDQFRARITQTFEASLQFEPVFDGLIRARLREARPQSVPAVVGYSGSWLGQGLQALRPPEGLEGEIWVDQCSESVADDTTWVSEVAMHCFVFRRK